MKKARKLVSLLAALVIALSCLPMTAFAADETYTIKIYSGNAPQNNYGELQALDFIYTGCLAFKNYCESNSSGRIKVEIYPSGQLGSTQEALQQCMQGTLQCVMGGDGETATLYPAIQAMSIPYLYNNRAEYYAMLDSEYMAAVYKDIEAQLGLKTLASADNGGFRNFSNDKKPVHSASDMAGLKIRTMESPIYTKMLESFGASATPMAYSELYSALQTGVVDGAEQPIANYKSNAFPEVANNLILDGHTLGAVQAVITDNAWGKLTENQQAAIMEAGADTQAFNADLSETAENKVLDELKSSGCNVVDVPDKAPWQEACQKVISENTSDQAELYQQLLDMKA